VIQERDEKMVDARADQGRARDGEDPGDNDATRDAPTNGGKATRGADADNGASDRVRCTDGNAELGVHDEREAAGGLRSESAEGRELGDALAHRFNDAPAAGHGAAAHGQVADDDHPIRNRKGFQQAAGDQRRGDNAHAFLRIVGAVAEAE